MQGMLRSVNKKSVKLAKRTINAAHAEGAKTVKVCGVEDLTGQTTWWPSPCASIA